MRERAQLSGYTLIKQIGSGGMSTVFEALSPAGERVALKQMSPGLVGDVAMRERFIREVSMLQRVSSSHVAQILDVELDDDVFIVTELVDGPTLEADVNENGVFRGQDLVDLATELAQALRAVHAVGVLHRDLKPSNVMIGESGVVLIDFGISQAVGATRLTQVGSVAHTPGYVDPRIITGSDPDQDADWWALAAVVGFAACGHPLFHGTPAAIMRQVLEGQPDMTGMDWRVAKILKASLLADVTLRLPFDQMVEALADLDNDLQAGSEGEFASDDDEFASDDDDFASDDDEFASDDEGGHRDERTQVITMDQTVPTLIAPASGPFIDSAIIANQDGDSEGYRTAFDIDDREYSGDQEAGSGLGAYGEQSEESGELSSRPMGRARLLALLALLGLSVTASWDIVITASIAGGAFLIFCVIGLLHQRYTIRKQRGKQASFALIMRFPLMVLHAGVLLVVGGTLAVIVGGAGAWLATYGLGSWLDLDIRVILAVVAFISLLILWTPDWAIHARNGWRLTVRELAPSPSYYVFWIVVALAILLAALVVGQSGYIGINQHYFYSILSA